MLVGNRRHARTSVVTLSLVSRCLLFRVSIQRCAFVALLKTSFDSAAHTNHVYRLCFAGFFFFFFSPHSLFFVLLSHLSLCSFRFCLSVTLLWVMQHICGNYSNFKRVRITVTSFRTKDETVLKLGRRKCIFPR